MGMELFLRHQREFLVGVKSRTAPEIVRIGEVEIIVNPGVFPPATNTRLLNEHVDIQFGQRFLDVSTGSGAIAVVAGLKGATGVAIDINPRAVQNARENIARVGVGVVVVESDMYANVPPEHFDRVYANGPFAEGVVTEVLDTACYGAMSFADKLFSGLATYLKPDGKALVVFPEWADTSSFEEAIKRYGHSSRVVATKPSDDGLRIYQLYEVKVRR